MTIDFPKATMVAMNPENFISNDLNENNGLFRILIFMSTFQNRQNLKIEQEVKLINQKLMK